MTFRLKRQWLLMLGLALLIAIPVGLTLYPNDDERAVESERVSRRALAPSVLASGTLMYESEVKLVPEVLGRVAEVMVQEGDRVQPNQIVLQLDPGTSLAEIAQLEAAKRQSELNIERQRVTFDTQTSKWKRYQQLREKGIVDSNTYEEVASQRALAEVELHTSRAMLSQTAAQLREAQERLAKTRIRSPIGGTVTQVSIKVGETAVPSATSIAGSNLMTIANTGSLHAEVNIDETDLARIGIGQEAKVVPAAFPDKFWLGTVEHVAISPRQNSGQNSAQNKSYPVRIRLAASDDMPFHPGMSCRVEISMRRADAPKALAVPVQAVNYEEAQRETAKIVATVFIVEAGKTLRREVETGIADDAYIEILRGVRENEEVVIGPAKTLRLLRDGDRVRVSSIPAPVAAGNALTTSNPGTGVQP